MSSKAKKPCVTCGVREKYSNKQRCAWCWLAAQPIDLQVLAAQRRLLKAQAQKDFAHRPRVPKEQWPEGYRWCAGCQSFVPLDYVSGSRCRACDSKGKHDSHLKHNFGIDPTLYAQLFAWQGGRCYMCGEIPRSRRLAVDHDHKCCPGERSCGKCVRGLLCADNEWGCNHRILGAIKSLDMAQRIVDYLEIPPVERMLRGDPQPDLTPRKVPNHDPESDPPPY